MRPIRSLEPQLQFTFLNNSEETERIRDLSFSVLMMMEGIG